MDFFGAIRAQIFPRFTRDYLLLFWKIPVSKNPDPHPLTEILDTIVISSVLHTTF